MMEQQNSILEINQLSVEIVNDNTRVFPIRNISFSIPRGKVVGIVGESGCGKSMTARSIMHLLPRGGKITSGNIIFSGEEISAYSEKQMLKVNGKRISMIFQEPMSSLNPVVKVGKQVEEVLLLHTAISRNDAKKKVINIFEQVGIPEPEKRYNAYPFQLSGGLRQRIMIAMAMICNPELLIADEPTTALDVTIEAQILQLMTDLQKQFRMSILMITHNLGVVAKICDEVNVMYLGQIVECCSVDDLFDTPLHPYTQGLISSVPRIEEKRKTISGINGVVPPLSEIPEGCCFSTRCPRASERCFKQAPKPVQINSTHQVRCHLYETNA